MTPQPDRKAEPEFNLDDKVLYDNAQATIIEIAGNRRASIRINENGKSVNRWVDFDELAPLNPPIPAALIEMTRKTWPGVFAQVTLQKLARDYLDQLNEIYAAPFAWFRVPNSVLAPDLHRQRASCETLARYGYLAQRGATGGVEYRVTPAGCDLLGLPHLPASDDSTNGATVEALVEKQIADARAESGTPEIVQSVDNSASKTPEAEQIFSDALAEQVIECDTLIQFISHPEKRRAGDLELTQRRRDGWYVTHIQIMLDPEGHLHRVIMLERYAPAQPAPQPEKAVEAAEPVEVPVAVPEPAVRPIGPLMSIQPGSYAYNILTEGLAATLDIADDKVAHAFAEAYQDELDRAQPAIRPIPLLSKGDDS